MRTFVSQAAPPRVEQRWHRLEYHGGTGYLFADAPLPALEAIRVAEALRQLEPGECFMLITIVEGHYDIAYVLDEGVWNARAPLDRTKFQSRRRSDTFAAPSTIGAHQ